MSYTSPNLTYVQAHELAARLQTAAEASPPGPHRTPVCRIVVRETLAGTTFEVVPPEGPPIPDAVDGRVRLLREAERAGWDTEEGMRLRREARELG